MPHNPKILGFHPGYVGGGQVQDLNAAYKKGNDAWSIASTVAAAVGQGGYPDPEPLAPSPTSPTSHQIQQMEVTGN